jgi:F-type H+-transporting ATPase subunit g
MLSSASSATNSYTPETVLSNIRNTNRQQLMSLGVIGAELLGFFTVGKMIGRMKLVGYHGEPSHEH